MMNPTDSESCQNKSAAPPCEDVEQHETREEVTANSKSPVSSDSSLDRLSGKEIYSKFQEETGIDLLRIAGAFENRTEEEEEMLTASVLTTYNSAKKGDCYLAGVPLRNRKKAQLQLGAHPTGKELSRNAIVQRSKQKIQYHLYDCGTGCDMIHVTGRCFCPDGITLYQCALKHPEARFGGIPYDPGLEKLDVSDIPEDLLKVRLSAPYISWELISLFSIAILLAAAMEFTCATLGMKIFAEAAIPVAMPARPVPPAHFTPESSKDSSSLVLWLLSFFLLFDYFFRVLYDSAVGKAFRKYLKTKLYKTEVGGALSEAYENARRVLYDEETPNFPVYQGHTNAKANSGEDPPLPIGTISIRPMNSTAPDPPWKPESVADPESVIEQLDRNREQVEEEILDAYIMEVRDAEVVTSWMRAKEALDEIAFNVSDISRVFKVLLVLPFIYACMVRLNLEIFFNRYSFLVACAFPYKAVLRAVLRNQLLVAKQAKGEKHAPSLLSRIFSVATGEEMAKIADDDLSIAETVDTGYSTLTSFNFEALWEVSEGLPEHVVYGSNAAFLEEFLLGESIVPEVLSCITLLFTAPSIKENPKKAIAHHLSNFSNIIRTLAKQDPNRTKKILKALKNEDKTFFGILGNSVEELSDADAGWMKSVGDGLEKMKKFEKSHLGSGVATVLGLVASLPILYNDLVEADTYMKTYKVIVKTFRTTGASLSSLLQTAAYLYRQCITAGTTVNPKLIMRRLFESNEVHLEYLQCYSLLRDLRIGHKVADMAELVKLTDRFRRLTKRVMSEFKSAGRTQAEINWVKEVIDMESELAMFVASQGDKPFPFIISLDGLPGSGKSTFIGYLNRLMHAWAGKADIMSVSEVDLSQNFDMTTTNATTCIVLDDQGNLVNEQRKVPLAGFLLRVGQGKPTQVHKPGLNEKGNVWYQVDFVILSDNKPERGLDKEVLAPMAAFRRLGICIEVRVKEEFRNVSGGIDNTKLDKLYPDGEHLEFRPYIFIQPKGEPVQQQNLCEDEWINNWSVLEFIKNHQNEHFEQQAARIETAQRTERMELCKQCQLGTIDRCACGQNFMDAEESVESDCSDASTTFESVIPLDRDPIDPILGNAGAMDGLTEMFRVSEQYAHNLIDAYLLNLTTQARFLLFDTGKIPFVVNLLMERCIVEAFVGVSLFLCAAVCMEVRFISIERGILMIVLTIFLILVRRAKGYWIFLRHSNISELMAVHTSNLAYFSSRAAIVAGVIATVVTSRFLWKSFVESVPMAESADSPKESEDVTPESKELNTLPLEEKQPPAIWKTPTRTNFAVSEQSKTTTEQDLIRLSMQNCVRCAFQLVGTDVRRKQNILLLCSNIGVTTAHVGYYKKKHHSFVIEPLSGAMRRPVKIPLEQTVQYPGSDLLFIYFRQNFGAVRDLRAYLPLKESKGTNACHKQYITGTEPELTYDSEKMFYKDQEIRYGLPSEDGTEFLKYHGYTGNTSRLKSGTGTCGVPYISAGKNSCIMAIHAAGSGAYDQYMAPLLRKQFDFALQEFEKKGLLVMGERMTVPLNHYPIANAEENPKHPAFFIEADSDETSHVLQVERWTVKNFTNRSQIKYNPHLVAAIEKLGLKLMKKKPSMHWKKSCRKVLRDASECKPDGHVPILMSDTEGNLSQLIGDVFNQLPDEYEWLRKPVTYDDLLNGKPGTLESMDLSKSSGVGGKKRDYVIEDVTDLLDSGLPRKRLAPTLQQDCDRIEDLIRSKIHPDVAATACLKDELLGARKGEDTVVQKEARVFYNSPFQIYLISSKFLTPLQTAVNLFPARFFTAIGLDPVGEDWQQITEQFAREEFDGLAIDLDYKAFDANQNLFLRMSGSGVFVSIAKMLKWDQEDIQSLIDVLRYLEYLSVNLFGAQMTLQNLLLSGFKYTAHRNGFITFCLLCYDFKRFCDANELDCSLKENMYCVTLGDDMVLAVSRLLRDKGWTPSHYVESCAHWGLTATAANKEAVPQFKRFVDCEFLKRYYNWHPDLQRNVFCASPASYLQPFLGCIPNSEWDEDIYYADQCDHAILEAFFGGKKSFYEIKNRMREYFILADCPFPESLHWTYEELVERYRGEPQTRHFDREDTGMDLICDYDKLEHVFSLTDYGFRDPIANAEEATEETDKVLVSALEGEMLAMGGKKNEDSPSERFPIEASTDASSILLRRVPVWTITDFSSGEFYPYSLMLAQPLFKERLRNVAFIRANLALTIEVVSPATYAGAMMFSVVVFPDSTGVFGTTPADFLNLSQRPNVILQMGQKGTVSKLDIPFLWPHSAISTQDTLAHQFTKVVYTNLTPLSSSATSNPTVSIKVYCQFTDLQAFGATATAFPSLPIANTETEKSHFAMCYRRAIRNQTAVPPSSPLPFLNRLKSRARKWCKWILEEYPERKHYEDTVRVNALIHFSKQDRPQLPDGVCYLYGINRRFWVPAFMYFGNYPKLKMFGEGEFVEWLLVNGKFDSVELLVTGELSGEGEIYHVVRDPKGKTLFRWSEDDVACWNRVGGEKISNVMIAGAKAGKAIAQIPGLGSLETPSEILAKAGNAVAMFGFSETNSKASVGNPTNYMANAMGKETSNVLAVNPNNEKGLGLPGFPGDELEFSYLNRWNLISVVPVEASRARGDELYQFNVTPAVMQSGQPASWAIPSYFFNMWRGSIEYRFTLVMPTMCTMRLIVLYDCLGPNHVDLEGAPKLAEEDYLDHVILDSSNSRQVTVRIGYTQPCPALHTIPFVRKALSSALTSGGDMPQHSLGIENLNGHWNDSARYSPHHHNGRLILRLHDVLRGGTSTTPPTAHILIEARLGPDMQFAEYTGQLPAGIKIADYPGAIHRPPVLRNLRDVCETVVMPMTSICTPFGNTSTGPPISVAPTAPPTSAPIPATLAPTNPPTTAVPGTTPPTTIAPTTALPTTAAPTTVVPTTASPTTAAPSCTGEAITVNRLFGSAIAPNVAYAFDEATGSYQLVFNNGTTTTNFEMWSPSFCGFYEVFYTVTNGNWTASTDLFSGLALEAPGVDSSIVLSASTNFNAPYNHKTTFNTDLDGAELVVRGARMYGADADHAMRDTSLDQVIRGRAKLFDEAYPYNPPAVGTIREDPALTTDVLVSDEAFGRMGWRVTNKAFVVDLAEDLYNPITQNDTYCTVEVYGSFIIRSFAGNMKVATEKNSWRVHTFKCPTNGFVFKGQEGTVYPKCLVRRFTFLTKSQIGATVLPFYNDYSTPARRLKSVAQSFHDMVVGNTETVEGYSMEGQTHHLGSPLDESTYFHRTVAGESVVSYRGLLKIPYPVANFTTGGGVGDYLVTSWVYDDQDVASLSSLYSYLKASFAGLKGSVKSHYLLIGNGSIEVSRLFPNVSDDKTTVGSAGVYFTDSRVNPHLEVRFPAQRDVIYTVGSPSGDDCPTVKVLRMFPVDDAGLRVREYRSTGEDFDFVFFRAAAKLSN